MNYATSVGAAKRGCPDWYGATTLCCPYKFFTNDLDSLYIYDCDSNHSPKADQFEVHPLVEGKYIRQAGAPVWLPGIGLGIGREVVTYRGWTREWTRLVRRRRQ